MLHRLCGVGVLCLLGVSALSSIAAATTPVTFNRLAATEEAVMITQDQQQFSVHLKANRTTGYQWFLWRYQPNIVEPVSQGFVLDSKAPGMVGVGGVSTWRFHMKPGACVVPRMTTLDFVYRRAWEKGAVTQANYHVNVYCAVTNEKHEEVHPAQPQPVSTI